MDLGSLTFCVIFTWYNMSRFEKDMRLKEDNLKTVFDMTADVSHRMG